MATDLATFPTSYRPLPAPEEERSSRAPRFSDIVSDEDYKALSTDEQFKVRKGFFQKIVAADPDFQTLPPEERVKVGKSFLFPEAKGEESFFGKLKSGEAFTGPVGQATLKGLEAAQAGIRNTPSAAVQMAKDIGKAAITPPEEGVFTPVSPSTSIKRLKDFFQGLASGATAGIYEPPPAENEAQAARRMGGTAAGFALPFTAVTKGAELVGAARPVAELIAGGVTGAAKPIAEGKPLEAIEQGVTGAGLVGAFQLGGAAFSKIYGRAPKDVGELREATKDPAFVSEIAGADPKAEALTPEQQARADAFDSALTQAEQLRQSPKGRALLARQLAAEQSRSQRLTPETPIDQVLPKEEPAAEPTAAQRSVSDLLAQAQEQLKPKPTEGNKTLQAAFDSLLGKEPAEAIAERAQQRGMIAKEETPPVEKIFSDPDYLALPAEEKAIVNKAVIDHAVRQTEPPAPQPAAEPVRVDAKGKVFKPAKSQTFEDVAQERLTLPDEEYAQTQQAPLHPAFKLNDGEVISGGAGANHGDLFNALTPAQIRAGEPQSGFVIGDTKTFVTPDQAAALRGSKADLAKAVGIEEAAPAAAEIAPRTPGEAAREAATLEAGRKFLAENRPPVGIPEGPLTREQVEFLDRRRVSRGETPRLTPETAVSELFKKADSGRRRSAALPTLEGRQTRRQHLVERGDNRAGGAGNIDEAIRTAEQRQAAEAESAKAEAQRGSVDVPDLKGYLNRDTSARDLTKATIRESAGELNRKRAQAERNLKADRDAWDKRPIADSIRFVDTIESGEKQVSPADQPLADQLRDILDQKRRDVQALGTGKLEHFIENYFPHLWQDPNRVIDFFARAFGKKPLAGPKSFLKQRTIPTIADGIAAGLKPVTYNPVDMVLLKAAEMDRYVMAENVRKAMVDQGLAKWVTNSKQIPQGWQALQDSSFQGALRSQAYYAPPEAAKVFNNYLSPGLKGNILYDTARFAGNLLNQAQLGLSAFHLGFTSVDAITSDASLAIEQALRGDVFKAAKSATRASTLWSPIENAITGNRLLKEYLNPGSYTKLTREANALATAGGKAFQDLQWSNQAIESFWKSWKEGNFAAVGLKAFPAALEYLSKPIMEIVVPRQKLGVFAKMATDILDRAEREGWEDPKIRTEVQKAWDSVDNRMGQIVYDNLFWDRRLKDLGMASVRSLGWNLGTVREIGGGLKDFTVQGGKLAIGKSPELTHRMAYVMALPIVVGYLGAVYQYLSTGEAPQELRDYFFPRTGGLDQNGRPERVSIPSYMKDVYAFSKHPLATIGHKVQPAISAVIDMLNNKDFYGTEIRHPGDPLVRQAQDVMEYVGEQFLPFSIRNARQRATVAGEEGITGLLKGEELPKTAQSFVGIVPAPASVNKTAAEEVADEFIAKRIPQGARTQEEAEQRDQAKTLTQRYRVGKASGQDVAQSYAEGKITKNQARNILTTSTLPPLVRSLRSLRLDEVLRVWDAATPEEQEQIRPIVLRKIQGLENYPPEQRDELVKKIVNTENLIPRSSRRRGAERPIREFFTEQQARQ